MTEAETGRALVESLMMQRAKEFADEVAPHFAKGDLMGIVLHLSTRIAFLEARIVALEAVQ